MSTFTNTQVSLFTPTDIDGHYKLGKSPKTVSLYDVLFQPLQPELVTAIRSEPDKDKRKQLKQGLYAITPSAICKGGRRAEHVISHTGLMAFDIDDIPDDIAQCYQIVKQIPHILYLGLSASGNGLWGLIPIAYPEKHSQHFEAMRIMFDDMDIKIDTAPKAVNSLRYLAYDENAFRNESAAPFRKLDKHIYTGPIQPVLHPVSASSDASINLINWFNANCTISDIDEILTNAGFSFHSHKNHRYRYTRPDKSINAGLSVDYHGGRRTLFSFSINVPMLNKWKQEPNGWSCSPMTALLIYGCGGFERNHWKMAFDYIRSKQP